MHKKKINNLKSRNFEDHFMRNHYVRGFVSNPHVEDVLIRPGKLNIGAVVGTDGTLTVTKDLSMEENFFWFG